jgi:hypothetical protein
MKKNIIKATLVALLAGGLTGCIDETLPADGQLTAGQASNLSTAAAGYANAVAGFMGMSGQVYSSQDFDLGYPGLGMIRDIYCEDFSINSVNYEYFYYWATVTYLNDNWSTSFLPWNYYYSLINNANTVLKLTLTDDTKPYFGVAYFYRALAYFDLARMYEFKKTGVKVIDSEADQNDIYGLTVPIIKETTTEDEARNTPRASFKEMYKFILDDLAKAEEYLTGYNRTTKNLPNVAVVNGERARVYLELASRFNNSASDLNEVVSDGVNLGATTVEGFYELAANCARLAITQSGATPLTEKQWFGGESYKEGFNSVDSPAWLLGASVNKEMLSTSEWRNFIGHMSPEQTFGVGGIYYNSSNGTYTNYYGAQRLISSFLFDQISDKDWRKTTWISSRDKSSINNATGAELTALKEKYRTNVADGHFQVIPAYASFKFRTKEGNTSDYSVAAAADYPLMRVEEMYFIEAEAKAKGGKDVAAGKAALESFINAYRYTDGSYTCSASSQSDFETQLELQKRIEFWGEGIVAWDYKRLNLQIVRDEKTNANGVSNNFPTNYRKSSKYGYCARWLNAYIPRSEYGRNTAIKPNPDPCQTDED